MNPAKKLRVLLVGPTQGHVGGQEAVMLALATELAAAGACEPRLCFKLVQGAQADEHLLAAAAQTNVPAEIVARASTALWRHLRWADIVHAHSPSPDVIFGARLLRKPVVVTLHWPRLRTRSWREKIWAWGLRAAQARCFASDFVRRSWESGALRPGSEIMPSRTHLSDLPITWERRGFLFLARLIANKGLEELLEAYAGAQLDFAQWPLTIAGDGPLRPWAEQFVADHHLTTVHFAGFVTGDAKFNLQRAAKWNVAPSRTQEALGLSPIEARHFAVPSIVTRDGGLPEAAGPEALLAEPGDLPGLRARLEEAATMPESEYRRRALDSQAQLRTFLRPLSDYQTIYQQLTKNNR